jgi:AcrR family transcriptional regulator
MSRTPDARRRAELLGLVADYTIDHGMGDLSLRPLAKAVGSSPRALLYHFGSKERLLVEVLELRRLRQMRSFDAIKADDDVPPTQACLELWRTMSSPQGIKAFEAFLDGTSLALKDRRRFPGFLEAAVESWLAFRRDERIAAGYTEQDARSFATILVAGFRGFMLDLCATGDRARIDRAVHQWLSMLEHFPAPSELSNAD